MERGVVLHRSRPDHRRARRHPRQGVRTPALRGYIGVWINGREADHRALIIHPGYLVWPGGRWSKDLPPDLFPDMEHEPDVEWHLLSTFRPHTGGTPDEKHAAAISPPVPSTRAASLWQVGPHTPSHSEPLTSPYGLSRAPVTNTSAFNRYSGAV